VTKVPKVIQVPKVTKVLRVWVLEAGMWVLLPSLLLPSLQAREEAIFLIERGISFLFLQAWTPEAGLWGCVVC